MKEIHLIYADAPQSEQTLAGGDDAMRAECFREARASATLQGRGVIGMWCIDTLSAQADVIEIWGEVPGPISVRHAAYRASRGH
jgi:hypothetical protein